MLLKPFRMDDCVFLLFKSCRDSWNKSATLVFIIASTESNVEV